MIKSIILYKVIVQNDENFFSDKNIKLIKQFNNSIFGKNVSLSI